MASAIAHLEILTVAEQLAQAKRLLSVREVAELLGEHDDTIYRRCKRGTMPHYRLGSLLKFEPAQVAKWLREHYVG